MPYRKDIPPRVRAESFANQLDIRLPILLAPMAGACPPSLSIAVANAGGLGACGAVAMTVDEIKAWAAEFRAGSKENFQINLWIPEVPPVRDFALEGRQREFLAMWGPAVPPEAGDTVLPDFDAQCQGDIECDAEGHLVDYGSLSASVRSGAEGPVGFCGWPQLQRSPKRGLLKKLGPTPSSLRGWRLEVIAVLFAQRRLSGRCWIDRFVAASCRCCFCAGHCRGWNCRCSWRCGGAGFWERAQYRWELDFCGPLRRRCIQRMRTGSRTRRPKRDDTDACVQWTTWPQRRDGVCSSCTEWTSASTVSGSAWTDCSDADARTAEWRCRQDAVVGWAVREASSG